MESCEPIRCANPDEQGGPCWYGGFFQGRFCGSAEGTNTGPLGDENPPLLCNACAAAHWAAHSSSCRGIPIGAQSAGGGGLIIPHLLSMCDIDVVNGSLENCLGRLKAGFPAHSP